MCRSSLCTQYGSSVVSRDVRINSSGPHPTGRHFEHLLKQGRLSPLTTNYQGAILPSLPPFLSSPPSSPSAPPLFLPSLQSITNHCSHTYWYRRAKSYPTRHSITTTVPRSLTSNCRPSKLTALVKTKTYKIKTSCMFYTLTDKPSLTKWQ